MAIKNAYLNRVYQDLAGRYADQKEFLQAVQEVLTSLEPVFERRPELEEMGIIERLVEPERSLLFRVSWVDDRGKIQVNRGYRVQFSTSIGPSKGGLRFHPSVNLSVIKFLGFEQIFKNSLTGLPMGGGKGGSDFDPKGKSNNEIMRFCQSFMIELQRHIGPDTDVPAGDMGVGSREIGYMFGQYKRIRNEFSGVLTGKDPNSGGSLARPEATGFGLCYFTQEMLHERNTSFQGKRVVISGSGNVATYANQKATQLGAKVVAMSDSNGYIVDENGIDYRTIQLIKEVKRDRIKTYVDYVPTAKYVEDPRGIWTVPCDIALPCATQNELAHRGRPGAEGEWLYRRGRGRQHAHHPGGYQVSPGQRHPLWSRQGGQRRRRGGLRSGDEPELHAYRMPWSFEEVDEHLKKIMVNIYHNIDQAAKDYGAPGNLVMGANIAGFEKVCQAMIWQGVSF